MPSVYLDTNIISGLAKGEYSEDVALALVEISALSKEGQVDLYTSEIAHAELDAIPTRFRKQHLVIYNLIKNSARPPPNRAPHQVIASRGRVVVWRRPTGNAPLLKELEALIPPKRNAEKVQARGRDIAHLHRFKQSGLDYFLTEDHKSILRYKVGLLALGIDVVSSVDLLALLR